MMRRTSMGARGPQSAQSCPALHAREKESGPPSSHSPSLANSHELSHTRKTVGCLDGVAVVGRLVGVREGERLGRDVVGWSDGRDVVGARLGDDVGTGTHDVAPDTVLPHTHHCALAAHDAMRCASDPL